MRSSILPIILSGRRQILAQFLAANPPSVWVTADPAVYGPDGLRPLYTTSTGITAATAATDSVGLALDRSQGITLGSELCPNPGGPFTTTTGWDELGASYPSTAAVVSGELQVTASAAFGLRAVAFATVVGRLYRVSGHIRQVSGSGGTFLAWVTSAGNGRATNSQTVYGASTAVSVYFVAQETTSYIALRLATSGDIGGATDVSIKEVDSNQFVQSTSGYRPTLQNAGRWLLRTDGLDDYLGGAWKLGSAGTLVYAGTLDAASEGDVIMGTYGSSSTRGYLGLDASGQIAGGIGSDGTTTIHGARDMRGQRVAAVLSWDGTTVRLASKIAGGSFVVDEWPQNGSPTTSYAANLAGLNNAGSPASFLDADSEQFLAFNSALTATQASQLTSLLLQ